MSFVNVQVNIDELPQANELSFEPMSAAYRKEVLAQLAIVLVPLVLASMVPLLFRQHLPLLLLPLAVLLLATLVSRLALKKSAIKGVALREHDIAYRNGLFWRKVVVLPRNRIQHVEVSSGPLQRRYGLATLKFFTAGGSSVDLKVDGLTRERAEQIRSFMTARNGGPELDEQA